jgi:hypothetical protein
VNEVGELLDGLLGIGAVLHHQQPARGSRSHLAELADDGAAYTWGSDGRLGLGDGQPLRRLTWVPQAVFAGSRVTMRHGVLRRHAHDGAASGDGSGARMDLRHERIRQLGVVDLTSRLAFAQVDAGQLGGAGARGW